MRKHLLFISILLLSTQCNDLRKEGPVKDALSQKALSHKPISQEPNSRDLNQDIRNKGNHEKKNTVNQFQAKPVIKHKHLKKKSLLMLSSETRHPDSLMLRRVNFLRANHIEIDLNEPVSREFFLSPGESTRFPTMIILSREKFLEIDFDNDIFDNTDQFYTNGIRIGIILPVLKQIPLSKLMIPYPGRAINFYGISLVQNLYTPSTTKTGGILYGDRPYAAYLYFSMFKITNDAEKNFRQTSEVVLGVIGPSSMGDVVQKTFHESVPTNNEPLGWEYQIKNDVVLNWHILVEKGLVNHRGYDLTGTGEGWLGSLYTNMAAGFRFRTGLLNPYFVNLGQGKVIVNKESGLHNTQLYFFVKSKGQLIGYDATLQGGLFNRASVYIVGNKAVNRIVLNSSAGLSFVWSGIKLDLEQFLLSPEMHHGHWHLWVHFGLSFCL